MGIAGGYLWHVRWGSTDMLFRAQLTHEALLLLSYPTPPSCCYKMSDKVGQWNTFWLIRKYFNWQIIRVALRMCWISYFQVILCFCIKYDFSHYIYFCLNLGYKDFNIAKWYWKKMVKIPLKSNICKYLILKYFPKGEQYCNFTWFGVKRMSYGREPFWRRQTMQCTVQRSDI